MGIGSSERVYGLKENVTSQRINLQSQLCPNSVEKGLDSLSCLIIIFGKRSRDTISILEVSAARRVCFLVHFSSKQ